MAIALVTHTAFQCVSSGTSGAINNTGATLFVAIVATSFGNSPVLSDSSTNTWVQIGTYEPEASNTCQVGMFYVDHPTVTASQTFSLASANFTSYCVASFSGTAASPLGSSSQGQDPTQSSFTVQPGSLTPTVDGSLLVTGATPANAVSVSSINSSFVITDNEPYSSGLAVAGAEAYLVQGSHAAINPTWTMSAAFGGGAIMAYFSPAAGGGGSPPIGQALIG